MPASLLDLPGGSLSDEANAIAVDQEGYAYVTGQTSSDDFPVVNAFQPTIGSRRGQVHGAGRSRPNPYLSAPLN
ncbi:MAG: SBBP repeat-containing protein [Acidobacteriota bacterium]